MRRTSAHCLRESRRQHIAVRKAHFRLSLGTPKRELGSTALSPTGAELQEVSSEPRRKQVLRECSSVY